MTVLCLPILFVIKLCFMVCISLYWRGFCGSIIYFSIIIWKFDVNFALYITLLICNVQKGGSQVQLYNYDWFGTISFHWLSLYHVWWEVLWCLPCSNNLLLLYFWRIFLMLAVIRKKNVLKLFLKFRRYLLKLSVMFFEKVCMN